MTGIEILSTEEIVSKSIFNWNMFFITVSAIFIIFILIGIMPIISSIEDGSWVNVLYYMAITFIISTGFAIIIGFALSKPVEYETHYKVLISDKVTVDEFFEKYEIIDQEGKIYTVKERK